MWIPIPLEPGGGVFLRLSDAVLPLLAILIIADWTIGFPTDADIEQLQWAIEMMLMFIVLIEIIPRWIRKMHPGDAKKFIGVLPTVAILFIIPWQFPNLDPTLFELLAGILIVVNLLGLSIVKRRFAKKYGSAINGGVADQPSINDDAVCSGMVQIIRETEREDKEESQNNVF